MSLKPFNFGVVTKRVLPLRALRYSMAKPMELSRLIELAAWGAHENLLEEISFSDDDILSWSPETAEDYKDKNSRLYAKLADLKMRLESAQLPVHAISCDLTSSAVFAHGAFTSNDPKVRELAKKKAERALEIGRYLNASLFVYEGDSDGFDSPFTVNWQEAWRRLASGLDSISAYANSQHLTNFRGGSIAPRQSTIYHYGYLNTPNDALAIIQSMLKDRNFWGIIPSSSQLDAQGLDKAPAQIANIIGARRLALFRLGGGCDKPFSRAPHPIFGTGNLSEMTQLLWLLDRCNWKGAVEYDNLASVSDAKTLTDDTTCKQFIANSANALTVALQLAEKIKVSELADLTPSEADLMAATLLGNLDVDTIILRTIKNLPPAFETPQPKPQQNAGNGQQKQNQNNPGNGQQKQNQNNPGNGQQKQNQNNPGNGQQKQNQQKPGNGQPQKQNVQPQKHEAIPAAIPAESVEAPSVSDASSPLQSAPAAPALMEQETASAPIQSLTGPASSSPAQSATEPVMVQPAAESPIPNVNAEQPASTAIPAQPQDPQQTATPETPATASSRPQHRVHGRIKTAPAPLPPPAPLQEDDDQDAVPAAEDELPLILPDEKKTPRKTRKSSTASRSTKTGQTSRRSPRKKTTPPPESK